MVEMGRIITVANQKGGVGKTTLSSLLAYLYKDAGYNVLAVDADPASGLAAAIGFGVDAYELLQKLGAFHALVAIEQERAEKDELYDANPGGANTALQLRAYGEIAYEIYDELRDAPDPASLEDPFSEVQIYYQIDLVSRFFDTRFGFRHPDLEFALRHMLGRAERNRDE